MLVDISRFFFKNEKLYSKIQFIFVLLLGLYGILEFYFHVETGLWFLENEDEIEKFVAGQMINDGKKLYSNIFAHHGPLLFILIQSYTKLFGAADFSQVRLIVVFFALCALYSIITCPCLTTKVAKIFAGSIFLLLIAFVWLSHGVHMLLYHQVAGFLFVIATSQFVIPALIDVKLANDNILVSSIAFTCICFTAYSYGPAVLLLTASAYYSIYVSHHKKFSKSLFSVGAISILFFVAFWLYIYGDIFGYFAYHFYFNQIVYSTFIRFTPFGFFNNFKLSLHSGDVIDTASYILFFTWILTTFILLRVKNASSLVNIAISMFFLILGLILTNPRGDTGFQNNAFLIFNLGLFSLMTSIILNEHLVINKIKNRYITTSMYIVVLVVVGLMKMADCIATTPLHGVSYKNYLSFPGSFKPSDEEVFNYIRSITLDNEPIQSLVFYPNFYIKSGRLPASGNYYYLPWQAAYNRSPLKKYKIDICGDLVKNRPTVIWFDNWKVWGNYSVYDYEPCVTNLIGNSYTQHPKYKNLFVRKDIANFEKYYFSNNTSAKNLLIEKISSMCPIDYVSIQPKLNEIIVNNTQMLSIKGWSVIDSHTQPVPPLVYAALTNDETSYFIQGERIERPDVSHGNPLTENAGYEISGYLSNVPKGKYKLEIANGNSKSLYLCDTNTFILVN